MHKNYLKLRLLYCNSIVTLLETMKNFGWTYVGSWVFFLNLLVTWLITNFLKEWYRGFKSDCPDGRLTPKAFMQIYSKCFPTGNANEFCDHVFRTFDTDKNGFIDFKEFLLAIDVTSSGRPEEKLNWAFK